jgi:hypothetical protein
LIDTVRWILIALAVPVIVFLVVTTIRRARDLSDRIDEYHQEEEEAKQSGEPINPYDAMSRIVDTRPKPRPEKREDGE